jgi:hypothetical protein
MGSLGTRGAPVTAAQQDLLLPEEPAGTGTAKAMLALLRRHYVPDATKPAGVFATEIQGPGSAQRRADLIWLGCTAATGNELVGHEVKVTRADLLNELADLTKSHVWQQYCDRWWLVIPDPSLIRGVGLPPSWGVMLPPSGRRTRSMTIHREAPALRPLEQGPALKTLAAWQHWKLRDAHVHAKGVEDRWDQAQQALREAELAVQRPTPSPEQRMIARIVYDLGGPWDENHIGTWKQRVQVEDLVAALRDLGAVAVRRDEALRVLDWARGQLEAAGVSISRALQEVRETVTQNR